MRRAGYDSGGGVRPSYRSSNASLPTTTTSRGRAPSTPSASATVLVNLDVHIQRATIGRDISPADEDLIVLFRRNSKEVTSEPTRWGADHVAVWNQHVGIQTSLLRSKRNNPNGASSPTTGDFVRKDYEIVLVALPSHSAVALFTLDFAEVVQLSQAAHSSAARRRSFRISPLKCRDLAATLEFDITWDYVSPSPSTPSTTTGNSNGSGMLLHHANPALAGLPPASTLLSHQHKDRGNGVGGPHLPTPNSSSLSSRRTTTASMSSAGSDLDELHSNHGGGGGSTCSNCRSARRRLERKELQIVQLETFLKESQKRIDALGVENEELAGREAAETSNAGKYRALSLRLVQELEVAFQFCANQVHSHAGSKADAFMFVPQFEFMERVKQFHVELARVHGAYEDEDDDLMDLHDAEADDNVSVKLKKKKKTKSATKDPVHGAFDFEEELAAAAARNERLGQQLAFLQRSMGLESDKKLSKAKENRSRRSPTDTSDPIEEDEDATDSDEAASAVLTMTEQLNNLERDNFQLRAKLQDARADLETYRQHRVGRSNSSLLSPSESSETATCATDTSTSMIGARSSSGSGSEGNNNNNNNASARFDLDRIREDAIGLEHDKLALTDELAAARAQIEDLARRLEDKDKQLKESKEAAAAAAAAAASEARTTTTTTDAAGDGGFLNKIYLDVGKAKVALEEKVKQLNALLMDATEENARLRIELEKGHEDADNEQELEALRRAVRESEDELRQLRSEANAATSRAQELNESLRGVRCELSDTRAALATANDAVAQLESEIGALRSNSTSNALMSPSSFRSQSSLASSFVTPSLSEDAPAVADLQKQLKLARQEVMQLRYRSNQLESASEKLDEMSKEKRALQAKLTALEGQLYEQRSRDVVNTADAPPSKVRELEDQLDTRDAQLQVVRSELEALRTQLSARPTASTGSLGDLDLEALAVKVAAFEREIETLVGRNEQQAKRIQALSTRVVEAAEERKALEQVLVELMEEVERVERTYGGAEPPSSGRSLRASSIPEESAEESKEEAEPPTWARRGSTPVNATGRVADRYASALATTRSASNSTASMNGGGAAVSPVRVRSRQASGSVTSSRIAQLMKNFSDGSGGDQAGEASRSGGAPVVKKPVKLDFRSRNGSTASSGSNAGSVDGLVSRFNRK